MSKTENAPGPTLLPLCGGRPHFWFEWPKDWEHTNSSFSPILANCLVLKVYFENKATWNLWKLWMQSTKSTSKNTSKTTTLNKIKYFISINLLYCFSTECYNSENILTTLILAMIHSVFSNLPWIQLNGIYYMNSFGGLSPFSTVSCLLLQKNKLFPISSQNSDKIHIIFMQLDCFINTKLKFFLKI